MATQMPGQPQRILEGGTAYRVNGAIYVVYDTGPKLGGLKVVYRVPDAETWNSIVNKPNIVDISEQQFNQLIRISVIQPNISETFIAASQNPGLTYTQWVDQWMNLVNPLPNEALADPEVSRIVVQGLVQGWDADTIARALKNTNYWRNRSQQQIRWSTLSEPDRVQEVTKWASQLAERYMQLMGKEISINDPQIWFLAVKVADGTGTFEQAVQWIRSQAKLDPESPWSRQLRAWEEERRQRAVDISNTGARVRQMFVDWGVPASDDLIRQWANDIVTKQKSEADLLDSLRKQAQVLYPWKDPNIETATAAQPWLQTYARVLERPAPSLFDPDVQRALNQGMPLYEFEQYLKSKPEWLQTKNALDDLTSAFSRVGQLMGFV